MMLGRRLLLVRRALSISRLQSSVVEAGEATSNHKSAPACCSYAVAGFHRSVALTPVQFSLLMHEKQGSPDAFGFHQQSRRSLSTSRWLLQEIRSIKTPPFAESITEGDIRWQKKVGDTVKEDEVIAEVETDKTSIPVPSPVNGKIIELLFADGAKVTAGAEVCKIQVGGAGSGESTSKTDKAGKQPPQKAAPEPTQKPATQPQQTPDQQTERAPDMQKEARSGSRPSSEGSLPETAPRVPKPPREPLSSTPVQKGTPADTGSRIAPQPVGTGTVTAGARSEHRVKMTRMRLRIAERLKGAQNTAAMLTTFNEIDMTNITELRQKFKDDFTKRHNIKLGFMSAFIRASSYALLEMPGVNAVIDDDTKEIVYRDYVDISVAVATPKGLVVPVLRNCEHMNFAEIEQGLNELGEKAKSNQLAIEDMDGGTFTISNGGVFGSLMGTPIINPPQSAILGMHGIFDRPVAMKGQVVVRPMMYVALTYDHRLIDGREAVTFLRKVKAAVEDPRIMLLGL